MEQNIFKGINAIEFSKRFQNNEDCYNYLITSVLILIEDIQLVMI